jgi:hypothetical protein
MFKNKGNEYAYISRKEAIVLEIVTVAVGFFAGLHG